jgi:predicted short-subunit dehydrogenase-like oxidoreductase (DUF2520 family)
MGLAAHADVFVNRHVTDPSKGPSSRLGRTDSARLSVPGIREELEHDMFNTVTVIGAGRAGSAIAARLRERGIDVRDGAELRLLCVPDRAIGEVARSIEPGPWVAHVSGGTPLTALDPHVRRFSVHPLQTLVRSRGPEQLEGAWGAVTGEDDESRTRALWLAETLGLRPFPLADEDRALYHAGAAIASNFLVTLYRTAAELFEAAAVPPEALVPLLERTIANGFELTGPIARGDWETVDRHREVLRGWGFEPAYDALVEVTLRRRLDGADRRAEVSALPAPEREPA